MEKRIIVAFILSFGVLYAFRAFFGPSEPSPQSTPPATSSPAPINASAPASEPPRVAESIPTQTPVASPVGDIHSDKTENIVVDTPLYTATISNTGGVLKSYKLKAYSDGKG